MLWLLLLGALLLLALLLFGLLRACGAPGSQDEGAGAQGGGTTQGQEQAAGGDTSQGQEQASGGDTTQEQEQASGSDTAQEQEQASGAGTAQEQEQASGGGDTTAAGAAAAGTAAGDGRDAGEGGGNEAGEAAATDGTAAGAQGAGAAAAQLQDARGNPVGTASFADGPNGGTVTVDLQQGQQAITPGEHAVHIHETGDITPDFEAAGEHLNPTGAQHGFDNPEGPHAGDLENIVVNEDGSASYETASGLTTLDGGPNSLLDSDGSALVIHEGADDYRTDPDGDSGERVAAGIIRGAATGEATTAAETTRDPLPRSGGPAIGSLLLPAAALLLGSGVLAYAVLRRRR